MLLDLNWVNLFLLSFSTLFLFQKKSEQKKRIDRVAACQNTYRKSGLVEIMSPWEEELVFTSPVLDHSLKSLAVEKGMKKGNLEVAHRAHATAVKGFKIIVLTPTVLIAMTRCKEQQCISCGNIHQRFWTYILHTLLMSELLRTTIIHNSCVCLYLPNDDSSLSLSLYQCRLRQAGHTASNKKDYTNNVVPSHPSTD